MKVLFKVYNVLVKILLLSFKEEKKSVFLCCLNFHILGRVQLQKISLVIEPHIYHSGNF